MIEQLARELLDMEPLLTDIVNKLRVANEEYDRVIKIKDAKTRELGKIIQRLPGNVILDYNGKHYSLWYNSVRQIVMFKEVFTCKEADVRVTLDSMKEDK